MNVRVILRFRKLISRFRNVLSIEHYLCGQPSGGQWAVAGHRRWGRRRRRGRWIGQRRLHEIRQAQGSTCINNQSVSCDVQLIIQFEINENNGITSSDKCSVARTSKYARQKHFNIFIFDDTGNIFRASTIHFDILFYSLKIVSNFLSK